MLRTEVRKRSKAGSEVKSGIEIKFQFDVGRQPSDLASNIGLEKAGNRKVSKFQGCQDPDF